jgi:integrase
MRIKLTDRFCDSAKPDKTGRTDFFDTVVTGLALRTWQGGKSWSVHFTAPRDGKRARLTLGTYPATSLAAARGKALEAKGLVEASRDPREFFAAQGGTAMTVAGLLTAYLEWHMKGRRSAAKVHQRLFKNVIPVIGAVKVADLHRRDLTRAVDSLMRRGKPAQAARVFEDMRAAIRWAVKRGDLDRNPIEGMASPGGSKARDRVLTDDEIRVLWNSLPKALAFSLTYQRILKLCLVTGQRVGEVAGMCRDELDLHARLWSLPGSRTKNQSPHMVPLSDLALSLIRDALADAGNSPFVFPCGDGATTPLSVARIVASGDKGALRYRALDGARLAQNGHHRHGAARRRAHRPRACAQSPDHDTGRRHSVGL